jgi:hypothetical protein
MLKLKPLDYYLKRIEEEHYKEDYTINNAVITHCDINLSSPVLYLTSKDALYKFRIDLFLYSPAFDEKILLYRDVRDYYNTTLLTNKILTLCKVSVLSQVTNKAVRVYVVNKPSNSSYPIINNDEYIDIHGIGDIIEDKWIFPNIDNKDFDKILVNTNFKKLFKENE